MNWTSETFGSNILDYLLFEDYDTANDLMNMALGEKFIAEKHGSSGRRRGSNSKPGIQFLLTFSMMLNATLEIALTISSIKSKVISVLKYGVSIF